MRVLLVSLGTRGDVEPFISIAILLRNEGHDVACCFPEQFRVLVNESDLHFYGLNRSFLELLEGEDGKITMGSRASFFRKIKAYLRLYRESKKINKLIFKEQSKIVNELCPDKIIYNIKAIYPLIWAMNNPNKTILISPIPYLIHFTKNHAHIGFHKDYGAFLNKLTYRVANWSLLKNVIATAKPRKVDYSNLYSTLLKTKTVYTISPSIIPRPNYWEKNIVTVGYPSRTSHKNWAPNEELKRFLKKHKKILFITFRSMLNDDSVSKSAMILNLLNAYNIPSIINTSSGGLIKVEGYGTSNIFFTESIPYNWILPKVYAVIHHGGSGTTHLGLKYGCPTLIIPHIIDQFMWNETISNLGLGPKGISINKISVKKLEPLILDLYQNNVYKIRAKQISKSIKKEEWSKKITGILKDTSN